MKVSKYIPWIPEVYLILSVFFYWYSTSTLLNPFAIGLLLLLVFVVTFKNKALGMMVSWVFLLLSGYMVLAMLSELSEFPEFNQNAQLLLTIGSVWLGLNLLLGTMMLLKWRSISPTVSTIKLTQSV